MARLIEQAWYDNHPVKYLLLPLSALFWLLSSLRRLLFKLGLLKQHRPDIPVIVVGNIGVGGTGKTPVVIYLVELLQSLGYRPGVISRGYGGKAESYPLIVTDNVNAKQAGDEPVLIQRRCQVPVVVSPDRIQGIAKLEQSGCNVVISDDGLQHYAMGRDIELVIVDGKRRFGNGWLMPAGPLREGLWRLNTVDMVINNGGQAQDNEVLMTLDADAMVNLVTGERQSVPDFVAQYANAPVNALAGIGNPGRFFKVLTDIGLQLNQQLALADHHPFSVNDFGQFDPQAPVLMTEKDAVKCAGLTGDNAWYLPVSAKIAAVDQEKITQMIRKRLKTYGL